MKNVKEWLACRRIVLGSRSCVAKSSNSILAAADQRQTELLTRRRVRHSFRSAARLVLVSVAVFGSIGMALPHNAMALETYCVATPDELDYAYRRTEHDDVEIHLVQGLYDLKNTALDVNVEYSPNIYSHMTMRGGYTAACSARTANPDVTRLFSTAATTHAVVRIGTFSSVVLESVKIYLTDGVLLQANNTLVVRNDRFEGNRSDPSRVSRAEAVLANGGTVRIEQSIFDKNVASGCALLIDTDASLPYAPGFVPTGYAAVVNSVFADNSGPGLCLRSESPAGIDGTNTQLSVYNTILWNNTGGDLVTRGTPHLSLFTNIYHVGSFLPVPTSAPVATIDANPLFTNPANGNYFIQFGSPAVNSGSIVQPGGFPAVDLLDDPRIVGSLIDRGAYETIVDDTVVSTVTSTSDSLANPPTGTLRWAVNDANANGFRVIRFNIPGACSTHVINLLGPLPDLAVNLRVDGFSQPGSSPNSHAVGNNAVLCVAIAGNGNMTHALRAPFGSGVRLEVDGVAFGGFSTAAIRLSGGSAHYLWGNQFGGALGGTAIGNSAVNVLIGGSSLNTTLGGNDPAQANLLNAAFQYGVSIVTNSAGSNSSGNQIIGNHVGASANGNGFDANGTGIFVQTDHNTISGNLVSGNNFDGIELSGTAATNNVVESNTIGVKGGVVLCGPLPLPACTPNQFALPNGRYGVVADFGASDNQVNSNEIATNVQAGIYLSSGINNGQRNSLLSNSIHDNGGLGIDLGTFGEDTNDNDGAPGASNYPNRGLNHPLIGIPGGSRHSGSITGALASINGDYLVQAFANASCSASGYGEGRWLIGRFFTQITNQNVGGNGAVIFNIPLNWSGDLSGRAITLIARDSLGNTSEFSQCSVYGCDTIFKHGFDNATGETCPAP